MKIFKFLATIAAVVTAQNDNYAPGDPNNPGNPGNPGAPEFDGIGCFHCAAKNMTHCEDIGMFKECPENAQSCMVEIRKRDGELESVSRKHVFS